MDDPDAKNAALATLNACLRAPELAPLTRQETGSILLKIQEFHGKAYNWTPQVSEETLCEVSQNGGYLLRTRIRAAIEFLDQLYQYGEAGETRITELGQESLEEDAGLPELPDSLLES